MRTLEFNVKGLVLEKDAACDFSGIVPNSSGYLKIRVRFDNTWAGLKKVAVFSERKTEMPVLLTNDVCLIPDEVLTRDEFEFYIVGRNRKNGVTIKTNKIIIEQER